MCFSSGGVTASSQWGTLIMNSMVFESGESSILNGMMITFFDMATVASRITCGDSFACDEKIKTMILLELMASIIPSW